MLPRPTEGRKQKVANSATCKSREANHKEAFSRNGLPRPPTLLQELRKKADGLGPAENMTC
eukprot:12062871-Prorocentrum_lima.AAC.1